MDFVINFVIENYLWFIIGTIVLLMIIVGFVAEKTDFGRKPFSSKKKEEENKQDEVSNETAEEAVSDDTANHDEPIELGNKSNTDDFASVNEPIELGIGDSLPDELSASEGEEKLGTSIETEGDDNIPSAETESSEDLYAPFGDQEIKAPEDEESMAESAEEETSEDDVWKF